MRRFLFAAVLGALLLTSTTGALAQDGSTYVPDTPGELTIEAAGEFAPGVAVTVTGDGFAPESLVDVTITDQTTATVVVDVETETDADGRAVVDVEMPADVLTGPHTVEMSGAATDGLIVQLRASVFVSGAEPATTSAPEDTQDDSDQQDSGDSTTTTAPSADAVFSSDDGTEPTTDEATDDTASDDTPSNDGASNDSADSDAVLATDDAAATDGNDGDGNAGFLIAVVAGVALIGGGALLLVRRNS